MADPTAPDAPPLPEQTLQIPLILLLNTQMRIDDYGDGRRMLVFGPVALGVPLNPDNEKYLRDGLNPSGILIAGPNALGSM